MQVYRYGGAVWSDMRRSSDVCSRIQPGYVQVLASELVGANNLDLKIQMDRTIFVARLSVLLKGNRLQLNKQHKNEAFMA